MFLQTLHIKSSSTGICSAYYVQCALHMLTVVNMVCPVVCAGRWYVGIRYLSRLFLPEMYYEIVTTLQQEIK